MFALLIDERQEHKSTQMILNCGVFQQWRPSSPTKTVCLASLSSTAEKLRQQLDNLHKEADSTRVKANNARLRLMRLSEAVDRLRRQAAISVQTGKENDAREMLFQKKKVMQAMEKLKTRIELFDELSAKLNEAISMKESLLVGNMSLDVDVTEPEVPSHVRIVSPVDENPNNRDGSQNSDQNDPVSEDDQNLLVYADGYVNYVEEDESNKPTESSIENGPNVADNTQSLKEIFRYKDFLEHLDMQLHKIEQELEAFVRFSNLLLDSKEKPEYLKVQHVTLVLEDVRHARGRIASAKQTEVSSNEA